MTELEETIIEWDKLVENIAQRDGDGMHYVLVPTSSLNRKFDDKTIRDHLERLHYFSAKVPFDDFYSVVYWEEMTAETAIGEALKEEDEKFFPLVIVAGVVVVLIILGLFLV